MTTQQDTLTDLATDLDGRLVLPDHPDYDATRQTFNGTIQKRPAAIALARTTDEVARTVRAARAAGLPIAVRGGGHGVAGHAVADGAVVVDLRNMRAVSVDPAARRARVEGGAVWEDVDRATMPHDLCVTGGTFWDTGVGGLTLSGGLGFVMGTAGLTCDNLMRATVVTADGSVVEAGPDGDPELLWALRGGGGNFGVVTEFEFRLHPLGPTQDGEFRVHLDDAPAALEALAAFARTAPDEVVIFAVGPVMETQPPDDVVPTGPFDHMVVNLIHQGSTEVATETAAPFTDARGVTGGFKPASYEAIQTSSGILPFGLRHYWKGHMLRDLDRPTIESIIAAMRSRPHFPSFVLFEALTGQARREPEGGAAFGQRAARWNVSALAIWEDPAEDDAHLAWARATADSLSSASYSGAGYANYASADESSERVRAGYGPERFARLAAVKRRYDPDNVFRFNNNIPPEG